MKLSSIVAISLFSLTASAAYLPHKRGTQFITGKCASDSDCASQCCGFRSGLCAGAIIAQERDGGCGFGDAVPNNRAAVALGSTETPNQGKPAQTQAAAPPKSGGSGKPPGTQFITGPCGGDGDCASGCCGFRSGLCAGAIIAQERDGGCGFGDAVPNNRAAVALGSTETPNQVVPGATKAAPPPAKSTGSGKPPGTQFITGACGSDGDCASGCCGFRSGLCAGAIIAQERDGGCGFGDAVPNNRAAVALGSTETPNQVVPGATKAAPPPPKSTGSGKPPGTQFITGACGSDSDCASGCCGFRSGLCAGAIIAQERDGGCGFGDAVPNNRAAVALGSSETPNQNVPGATKAAAAPPAATANSGSGKPPGTQFITGQCGSDADCATSCCGFHSGKCAGAIVAQERDGGCGFGDAQPNDRAAQALRQRGLHY